MALVRSGLEFSINSRVRVRVRERERKGRHVRKTAGRERPAHSLCFQAEHGRNKAVMRILACARSEHFFLQFFPPFFWPVGFSVTPPRLFVLQHSDFEDA